MQGQEWGEAHQDHHCGVSLLPCFFFTSRLAGYIGEKFVKQGKRLKTYRLAIEDFRRFCETEEDEIARLSPRELVHQIICLWLH
jgi:hypothetical protein